MTQQVAGPQPVAGRHGHHTIPPSAGWHVVPPQRRAPVDHHTPAPGAYPSAYPTSYPTPAGWAPAPSAPTPSGASRSLIVVALTVVALAVLTLVGVLLYPRIAAPTTVVTPAPAAAPTTVVVPSPAGGSSGSSSGSSSTAVGGYTCGNANGYSITVNNGNVPCTSARWVTTMWTTDGTTPMSGTGPAGTPYSWTCSSVSASTDAVGSCVSKMGSTFTISR